MRQQENSNDSYLFGEIRQPNSDYVLIPKVSSEKRRYIPMGMMTPDIIASDLCLMVPAASPYHFGVLTSAMHMAWMRQVCGRLKSDYRYSNNLVYNNFPFPPEPDEKRRARVAQNRTSYSRRARTVHWRNSCRPLRSQTRCPSLS